MHIVEMAQNSPEWLKFRRKHIGASDAPIIMEVSPWKTPATLLEEKSGRLENVRTKRMQEGHDLEQEARQELSQEVGMEIIPLVGVSEDYEWMMASFDGVDSNGNIYEIKCPGEVDHNVALSGKIPIKYYPQLQHQMYVKGREENTYYSYRPGSKFLNSRPSTKMLKIHRDEKYISKMLEKEKEFYECMLKGHPLRTDLDFKNMDNPEWEKLSNLYFQVQEQLKILEEKEKQLKEELIQLSGRSNAKGAFAKLSKIMRNGSIDYSSIPELNNVDLEKYRKPAIETWRIIKT